MSTSPDQLEQAIASKIAKSIQISPDDALLGFLDVDEATQQEILLFLRSRPSFVTINQYLRRYPALTCYGLAVAAPIGLQDDDVGGGAFYGAWQSAFGFFPPQQEREPLAHEFLTSLDRLGLPRGSIFSDQEIHIRGGCYLFHGAILLHFVEPLRTALESAQKVKPLPDPDDVERAASFALYLAEKVHPAQQRLHKTLQSRVGSFLIRRLVRWLLTGDDSLFPAHIKPLLQEQRGRAIFLRSPYILFDDIEGQMQLALPAQTPTVADPNTRWQVAGRQYRASSEQPPLILEDLGIETQVFDVTLSNLKDERENISYHLQAGILEERGFRIFDASTSKERKLTTTAGHIIELTPGQTYFVVLDAACEVKSDHCEHVASVWRFVRMEVTPGCDPLELEFNNQLWTLKVRVRPGLYFNQTDGRSFKAKRTIDGSEVQVSYGNALDLICAIPAENVNSAALYFSTRFDSALARTVTCSDGSLQDDVKLSDAGFLLTSWLESLPAALHAVTITLECDGRRMTQELFYWKGLQRITIYGELYCDQLPSNLSQLFGFKQSNQALLRLKERGGKAELCFKQLGSLESEKWEIPANRVRITIVSPEGETTELDEGSNVDVLSMDCRVIQFHTGGLLPIRLTCNGATLGEISTQKTVVSRFLKSLAAEHGKTGVLKAEAIIQLPGEKSWTVLNWQTPQTAKECRQDYCGGAQVIWLIRKVSISGVAKLRVRLVDFRALIEGVEAEAFVELPIPTDEETNAEVSIGRSFSCSARRKPDHLAQVRVTFDRAEQKGSVWIMELECQLSDSMVWQPVLTSEYYGRLALARLILKGGAPDAGTPPSAFADLFWGKPLIALTANSPAWALQGEDLKHWFNGVQWLMACKYPTPVWKQNGFRFKSLYQRLSRICFLQENQARCTWWSYAISGLQKHADDIQPVVMPCLLLTSSVKMAATTLKGCDLGELSGISCVVRAYREACIYENRTSVDALSYVKQACLENRIDLAFLSQFSKWRRLMENQPVILGDFNYREWSNKLEAKCGGMELNTDTDVVELMSATHFVSCLTKAKRRADVLLRVSEQDYGHWLSGPIANIWANGDRILSSIGSVLGNRLTGAPASVLLRPLTHTSLMEHDLHRRELLGNLMAACCLVALLVRARSAGVVKTAQVDLHLHSLIGGQTHHPDNDDKLASQIALVVGTAPELFSYYFLLFTLTLTP